MLFKQLISEKKVVSCVNVSKVEPGVRESGVREPGVRESGVREPGVREPGVRRDVTPSDYTGHAYMNLEVVDPNNKLQLEGMRITCIGQHLKNMILRC